VQDRLSGLLDQARGGAPRSISDAQVAEVVRTTLEKRPRNATHWSTRSLAGELGLSHDSIAWIWKAFGLQPYRHEHFQFSTASEFLDKVRDVVGFYMSPPQNAVVLCLDEKSQCQALERTQPILPLRGGAPERSACEYFRHGTTSLFAALNVATGEVIGKTHRKHTQQEFLSFLRTVERQVPRQLEMHAILYNYATQRAAAVKAWLARHLATAFHTHLLLMAQPSGALFLRFDDAQAAPQHLPQRGPTRASHPHLPGRAQSKTQAFPLDSFCRFNTRKVSAFMQGNWLK
jgi:hypothetical protein